MVAFDAVALGLVGAAELRDLRPANVPGLLEYRRNLRVGNEAVPALHIPVEERPDAVVLMGIPEDRRPWSRAAGAFRRPWSRRSPGTARSPPPSWLPETCLTSLVNAVICRTGKVRNRACAPHGENFPFLLCLGLRRQAPAHRANLLHGI